MPTTDGKSTSFETWVRRWVTAVATLLLLVTTAVAGPDSSNSTISLEIRAQSLTEPQQGDLTRGSNTAPVSVVAFTDFHCPYCKLVQPTLQSLLVRYGDRIRIVHRDFPIARLHPLAQLAHEAARCAAEQDGFWAYHDKILAGPASADIGQLRDYARDTGLDDDLFQECLESHRHEQSVQKDVDEGIRLGVRGTPTFFINGLILRGMHPLESFTTRIDAELARRPTSTSVTSHPAEASSASR